MAEWFWEFPAGSPTSQQLYADRDGTASKPWVLGPNRFGINPGAVDIRVFSPGDTLWILDDHTWANYTDQATFVGVHDLTIRGDHPGRPGRVTYLGLSKASDVSVIGLESAQVGLGEAGGVTFDTLHVHDGAVGFRVSQEANTSHITIRNSTFNNLSQEGLEVFARPGVRRDYWTIVDNHIYNVGLNPTSGSGDREGIGVQRLNHATIARNHIHDCLYGINLWESGNGSIQDVTIYRNVIHDIYGGPAEWPSRGIMFSGGATKAEAYRSIQIYDNTVYNVGKEGLRLPTPSAATGICAYRNHIANVNTEHGFPNTEYLAGTTPPLDAWGNLKQESFGMAVYEVAIATGAVGGSAQEGDIICVREPLGQIGKKEQARFLWLLVESETDLLPYAQPNVKHKHPYHIPLEDLESVGFTFDLNSVRDPNTKYQPGLEVGETDGKVRGMPTLKQINTIIREKP